MHTRGTIIIMMLILLMQPNKTVSALSDYPDKDNSFTLFHIERSRDPDIVAFTVNIDKEGRIDNKEAIKVFWIRNSDKKQKEPLTKIQKKLAYGVDIVYQTDEKISFHLVSFPEMDFLVRHNQELGYYATTKYKDKDVIVKKVYIKFQGNSFLVPVIDRVDIFGSTPEGEDYIIDSIFPKS